MLINSTGPFNENYDNDIYSSWRGKESFESYWTKREQCILTITQYYNLYTQNNRNLNETQNLYDGYSA
jgi:hypothetical protein